MASVLQLMSSCGSMNKLQYTISSSLAIGKRSSSQSMNQTTEALHTPVESGKFVIISPSPPHDLIVEI
jgi:hypothetical protein